MISLSFDGNTPIKLFIVGLLANALWLVAAGFLFGVGLKAAGVLLCGGS